MKRRSLLAAAVMAVGLALPSLAAAETAYTLGTTNLRSGPSTDARIIATLYGDTPVYVAGCIRGYRWCDVEVDGLQGWIAASRLEFVYEGERVLVPRYYQYFDVPIIVGPRYRDPLPPPLPDVPPPPPMDVPPPLPGGPPPGGGGPLPPPDLPPPPPPLL